MRPISSTVPMAVPTSTWSPSRSGCVKAMRIPAIEVREGRLRGEADDERDHRRGGEDRARDRLHLRDDEERREHADDDDGGDHRPPDDAVARHRVRAQVRGGARAPVGSCATTSVTRTHDARDQDVLPEIAHGREFSRRAAASCPRSPLRARANARPGPRRDASKGARARRFPGGGPGSRRARGRGPSPARRQPRARRRAARSPSRPRRRPPAPPGRVPGSRPPPLPAILRRSSARRCPSAMKRPRASTSRSTSGATTARASFASSSLKSRIRVE